jgi:hypothetical protein
VLFPQRLAFGMEPLAFLTGQRFLSGFNLGRH